ncbi:endonuclease III [Corynebacterium renale]|uniref:Endonuclease III n=2 Tax=Corynebacterium renale TaxID=1724 RepID=A0A2A9DMR9_9CORY|nr:DNA-(apurinic or apyrimidinic site) lyase /endonuclease III [Corynebacterium renale]SQI23326.1 endonuclease III [Corynebacterium renale]
MSGSIVKMAGMASTLTRPTPHAPGKHPAARGESQLARVRRARRINRTLEWVHPDAHCELDFNNAFELLVATVLSAQTTDVRVNSITPALFAAYPTPEALGEANIEEVEEIIRPTGFYRAKAKNIVGLGHVLATEHGGEVPEDMESLVALPGVGRKTAHVVRGNAFGYPGLTIDTHVGRLARRLQLTENEDPVAVEKDLAELIEKREWTMFSHRMIFQGRRVCHSRKAACGACVIAADCPSFGLEGPADPVEAEKLVTGDRAEELVAAAREEDRHYEK